MALLTDVQRDEHDDRDRENRVAAAPELVGDAPAAPAEGGGGEQREAHRGVEAPAGEERAAEEIQAHEDLVLLRGEPEQRRVRCHEDEHCEGDVAVEGVDEVAPVGRLEPAEPGRQDELQAHHGERQEAEPCCQLGAEIPSRRHRARQGDCKRRGAERQVENEPRGTGENAVRHARPGCYGPVRHVVTRRKSIYTFFCRARIFKKITNPEATTHREAMPSTM